MIRELFMPGPLMTLPLVAMLLFAIVFAATTFRALFRSKSDCDALAHLPFRGGDRE